MSTMFPLLTLSSHQSSSSLWKSTPMQAKLSSKPDAQSGFKSSSPKDAATFPDDLDCPPEECPIFCCEHPLDGQQDEDTPDEEGVLRHNIEKKSGTRLHSMERKKMTSTSRPKSEGSASEQRNAPKLENLEHPATDHKLKRRMIEADEDNSQIYRTEYSSDPILHLLELNVTLLPELCTEERSEDSPGVYVFCTVYLSRHFSHVNITLDIRVEDSDTVVEKCGSRHYLSCPKEALKEENVRSENNITKREAIPLSHTWQLPVGSYIRSRYRFRMTSRAFSTDAQQICSSSSSYRPFTEYVLTFQRRCDK